jgi:hypothetical protein
MMWPKQELHFGLLSFNIIVLFEGRAQTGSSGALIIKLIVKRKLLQFPLAERAYFSAESAQNFHFANDESIWKSSILKEVSRHGIRRIKDLYAQEIEVLIIEEFERYVSQYRKFRANGTARREAR